MVKPRLTKHLILIFSILLVQIACKRNTTELTSNNWEFMGLDGKLVSELKLIDHYLYACAGRDGLLRLNLQSNNYHWEYLGFSDSTLYGKLDYGVVDLYHNPDNDNIFLGISTHRDTSEIGIFRSKDLGLTWVPSDSGIRTVKYQKSTQVASINGSSLHMNIMLVGMAATIFKSSDGGLSWNHVWGNRDAGGLGVNAIKFNITKPAEVWAGGETSRFAPFLLHSNNSGDNWEMIDNLPSIGPFAQDNSVYDIAVDPINEGTIFLAMQGIILKTVDNGSTWEQVANGNGFYRIQINTLHSQELFVSGDNLYHTIDGANSWDKIPVPNENSNIYSLSINWERKIVYTSTIFPNKGVYKLNF
jgi:hypothetical protein